MGPGEGERRRWECDSCRRAIIGLGSAFDTSFWWRSFCIRSGERPGLVKGFSAVAGGPTKKKERERESEFWRDRVAENVLWFGFLKVAVLHWQLGLR